MMVSMCPAAKRLLIGTFVLAVLGSILVIAGVSLPFWRYTSNFHTGVFQTCETTFNDCELTSENSDVSYRGARFFPLLWGLAILGVLFLIFGLVFLFVYACRDEVDHCKICLVITTSIAIGLAVLSLLVCLVVFWDWYYRYHPDYNHRYEIWEHVGFAWYMTLAGIVCLIACVICLGLHVFFMLYYSERSNKIHAAYY